EDEVVHRESWARRGVPRDLFDRIAALYHEGVRIHHVGDGAEGVQRESEPAAQDFPEALARDEARDAAVVLDDGKTGDIRVLSKLLLELRCENPRRDGRVIRRDRPDLQRADRLKTRSAGLAGDAYQHSPVLGRRTLGPRRGHTQE